MRTGRKKRRYGAVEDRHYICSHDTSGRARPTRCLGGLGLSGPLKPKRNGAYAALAEEKRDARSGNGTDPGRTGIWITLSLRSDNGLEATLNNPPYLSPSRPRVSFVRGLGISGAPRTVGRVLTTFGLRQHRRPSRIGMRGSHKMREKL
jgi:hypothetical protein